jgi:mannitol 2-dehydrogenase
MSCDNIQGNGHVAQEVFAAFARLRDPELGEWVESNVTFPNSMVDRITPVTTDDDRAQISERFGVEDAWPVVCEPFTQWALEDKFPSGRPPLEDVGVQVVPDVMPYELMKLRLLNASHQALCYFGYLAGYRLVHEVAQDQLFANFLLDYMNREATPTLAPVPGIDLDEYKLQLIERFSNAAVRDTVARLCAESSDRIPKWLLPVIQENLAASREVTCRRPWLRVGPDTPRVLTSRESRSRWSIGWPTHCSRLPLSSAMTRSPSSRTASCLVIWQLSRRLPSRT